jgi:hypothetical protein
LFLYSIESSKEKFEDTKRAIRIRMSKKNLKTTQPYFIFNLFILKRRYNVDVLKP